MSAALPGSRRPCAGSWASKTVLTFRASGSRLCNWSGVCDFDIVSPFSNSLSALAMKHRRPRPPALRKSWSAPLAGKPSTRGLFGFPEDTGAAPIMGAPAAHLILAAYSLGTNHPALLPLSLIWIAHLGFDRMLGYGLKYPTRFKGTHLNPNRHALDMGQPEVHG